MNESVVDFKLKDGVETTIRSLRGFFGAATQRKKKYMFFFFCNARTVVKHQTYYFFAILFLSAISNTNIYLVFFLLPKINPSTLEN